MKTTTTLEVPAPRRSSTVHRIAGCIAALICSTASLQAQEMPEMPKPVKEHEWLQKFMGEWNVEMECSGGPGQEPMKGKGTEKVRMLGGFWVISEGEGEMMGQAMSNILTIGYDTDKKKYVGTWVDSMMNQMWKYEGTVNSEGTTLTLETEGPCPMQGGKICKFREAIEFKGKDQKVFTSSIQGEDGAWTKIVTATATRTK